MNEGTVIRLPGVLDRQAPRVEHVPGDSAIIDEIARIDGMIAALNQKRADLLHQYHLPDRQALIANTRAFIELMREAECG